MANYQRVSRKQLEQLRKENKILVEEINKKNEIILDAKREVERIKNESGNEGPNPLVEETRKELERVQGKNTEYSHQVGTLSKEKEDLEKRIRSLEEDNEKISKELQGLKMKPNKGGKNGSKSGNQA